MLTDKQFNSIPKYRQVSKIWRCFLFYSMRLTFSIWSEVYKYNLIELKITSVSKTFTL